MADSCPACDTTDPLEFVELWDGRHYCQACVDAASPTLATEALRTDELTETFTCSPVKLGVRCFFMFAASWSCLWLIFPLLSVFSAKMDFGDAVEGWVMLSVFPLPIIALFSLAHAIGYGINRPTTSVNSGQLTVTQKGRRKQYRLPTASGSKAGFQP